MKPPLTVRPLMGLLLASLALAMPLAGAEREPREERLAKMQQRFPDADANQDGKLTLDEARAYLNGKKSPKVSETPTPPGTTAEPAPTPDGKPAKRTSKAARRSGDAPKPDVADLSYGSHPNNQLDLWLAKSDAPTPLVVFIHGGGFVGGDKGSASGTAIRQCLDAGVSFASVNYRFRTEAPINVVLRDAARAIQFLRSKAPEYHFDKTRVAAFGGSAGAGTSLWLAFHDDLADLQSADPVLRESTRLAAAASSAGQATYDILRWEEVLGSAEAMRFYPQSMWPAYYGVKTVEDLQTDEGRRLRADVDMLGMISRDDPPVWLGAGTTHDTLANKGDTNHSPKHSEAVKKRCDEIGVPAELKVGAVKRDTGGEQLPVAFLLKHLVGKGVGGK